MHTVLPWPSSEEPYFSRSVRMRVSVCLAQKARSMRKLTYAPTADASVTTSSTG